jgi:hypothetical protein
VSCNLNEKYVTAERTGNGQPHMRLER